MAGLARQHCPLPATVNHWHGKQARHADKWGITVLLSRCIYNLRGTQYHSISTPSNGSDIGICSLTLFILPQAHASSEAQTTLVGISALLCDWLSFGRVLVSELVASSACSAHLTVCSSWLLNIFACWASSHQENKPWWSTRR